MYNRYICPLQPCTHLTLKLLIQGHPQSAKVTHIADFKSAYISLIGPRGLQCETNQPNLKVLITRLLLVLEVWDGKPTYMKSWTWNLVVLSDLTLGPSFKVEQR